MRNRNLLFNPFTKIAGWRAFAIGLIVAETLPKMLIYTILIKQLIIVGK